MIKLPSDVEINNLIDDLRILSWEAADKLLYYAQILKDSNNKSNILKNDNKEDPVTLADLKVNEIIIQRINEIPNVTVAHITTGKFNVFCKIRAKGTTTAKNIIFRLDEIEGVYRTESMISLEESINDKKRLMHSIFKDLS